MSKEINSNHKTMRTIKFRGKKLHNGNWVCGYLTDVDNTLIGKVGIINSKPFSGCEESSMVIAETIGQFTGLYDKNGKEIYEGDIVEYYKVFAEEIIKVTDIVTFENGCFLLEGNDSPLESFCHKVLTNYLPFVTNDGDFPEVKSKDDLNKLVVIGNIYDNKEILLKNKYNEKNSNNHGSAAGGGNRTRTDD